MRPSDLRSRDLLSEYAAKSLVRVELFTRSYHVSGDVEVNRWRLADVLNDTVHPFVLMQHAVREPLVRNGSDELARAATILQITKQAVIFAIPHEAPELATARQQYLAGLYAERRIAAATMLVPPFEIRGTVHLRRLSQVRQALEDIPAEFVPMTHVDVIYLPDPKLRFNAELAVVNRPAAEIFSLASERSPESARGFRRDS
ncbi:MAG: hypothetical protein QOF51_4024 [Chloroflexota bacterium]|jgi:hypothetical protein|nr:hypothetical protein [Chloroflexota bacterium]